MDGEAPKGEAKATISILLRSFLAYTRARSSEDRIRLEREILELFGLLGAVEGSELREVRTEFDLLRLQRVQGIERVAKISDDARDFTTYRIRVFENLPGNPGLTGPARNMLRIPLSEVAKRTGQFNEEQTERSLERVLNSVRTAPVSPIEGDNRHRTSIAVIRAFAENFCNIPPFCSGRSS